MGLIMVPLMVPLKQRTRGEHLRRRRVHELTVRLPLFFFSSSE